MPRLLPATTCLILVTAALLSGSIAAAERTGLSGEAIYKTKCLLCHPDSPGMEDGPGYKARPGAVPLWTLYEEKGGWRDSQIGLGRWSDARMDQWLRYPKGMKPGTSMIEVPLDQAERRAVIRYIKQLGRKYGDQET
ncbi:c-type cytochrome [Thiohalorhabdus sp. Cl-TMA]|uniref:Cytochrome c family protein n=1 Tax=Thiohalorhabdus methylotrophus TaxID=3242694 RepID=A0ABV4TWK7_9GAMM